MGAQDGNEAQTASHNLDAQDITTLNELVKGNTPTRVIALKMERTPAAIQNKVSSEGMSLRPTNQKL